MAAEDSEQPGRKGKRGTNAETAKALLDDSRFSAFFEDDDFVVDEKSHTYKELNPNAGAQLPISDAMPFSCTISYKPGS